MAGVSKIDKLGIGGKVLALRKDLTCEEIADEINARYLPAGAEPVNKMTISRYCAAHGMPDMQYNNISKKVVRFDALEEAWAVKNRLERQCNKLEKFLERIKEDEEKLSEYASINNAYLNSCSRLNDLNESVSRIQKEQLGLQKVRRVLSVIMGALEKHPAVKSEVYEQLRNSEVFETIQAI